MKEGTRFFTSCHSRAPKLDARLPRVSKTICERSRRSSLYSAVVQEMVNYLHYFTNNVKNYIYHDLHIYCSYQLSKNKINSEINPKCIIRRVSLQPIGRQPPKDTANQHQGRHAPLFSYQTTRDARIKFWDFGRTRIP